MKQKAHIQKSIENATVCLLKVQQSIPLMTKNV